MPDPATRVKWLPAGHVQTYHKEMEATVKSEGIAKPISYSSFSRYWSELFSDYRILSGKRADKCDECAKFYDQLCSNLRRHERRLVEAKRARHIASVRKQRQRYYRRQKLAQLNPKQFLSIILDGPPPIFPIDPG